MAKKEKFQHRENSGSMFENLEKENEKWADFTGEINVGGTVYWLKGWKKMTDAGKKWISVSVREKEEPRDERQARPTSPSRNNRAAW